MLSSLIHPAVTKSQWLRTDRQSQAGAPMFLFLSLSLAFTHTNTHTLTTCQSVSGNWSDRVRGPGLMSSDRGLLHSYIKYSSQVAAVTSVPLKSPHLALDSPCLIPPPCFYCGCLFLYNHSIFAQLMHPVSTFLILYRYPPSFLPFSNIKSLPCSSHLHCIATGYGE